MFQNARHEKDARIFEVDRREPKANWMWRNKLSDGNHTRHGHFEHRATLFYHVISQPVKLADTVVHTCNAYNWRDFFTGCSFTSEMEWWANTPITNGMHFSYARETCMVHGCGCGSGRFPDCSLQFCMFFFADFSRRISIILFFFCEELPFPSERQSPDWTHFTHRMEYFIWIMQEMIEIALQRDGCRGTGWRKKKWMCVGVEKDEKRKKIYLVHGKNRIHEQCTDEWMLLFNSSFGRDAISMILPFFKPWLFGAFNRCSKWKIIMKSDNGRASVACAIINKNDWVLYDKCKSMREQSWHEYLLVDELRAFHASN